MSNEPSQGLQYAKPRELPQPRRIRTIAILSVLFGIITLAMNALFASAMANQLLKNWQGTKGVSPPQTQPWLLVSTVETALSSGLAIYLMAAGTMTLRRLGRGPRLHQWYAKLKLPLAIAYAVWTGWAMAIFGIRDLILIIAAGALAFIASAAYPLYLLDTFRKLADVLDDPR